MATRRRRRSGTPVSAQPEEITAALDELEVRFLLDPETVFDDDTGSGNRRTRTHPPHTEQTPQPDPPNSR